MYIRLNDIMYIYIYIDIVHVHMAHLYKQSVFLDFSLLESHGGVAWQRDTLTGGVGCVESWRKHEKTPDLVRRKLAKLVLQM